MTAAACRSTSTSTAPRVKKNSLTSPIAPFATHFRRARPVELKPMTSNERRSVHHYLLDNGDVDTHSVGEDPDRRIVVTPAGVLVKRFTFYAP